MELGVVAGQVADGSALQEYNIKGGTKLNWKDLQYR